LHLLPQNKGVVELHPLSSSSESDVPNVANPNDYDDSPNSDNNKGKPPPGNDGGNRDNHNNGNGGNMENCKTPNYKGFAHNGDASKGPVEVGGLVGNNRSIERCNGTNIRSTSTACTIATNQVNVNVGRCFDPNSIEIADIFAFKKDLVTMPSPIAVPIAGCGWNTSLQRSTNPSRTRTSNPISI